MWIGLVRGDGREGRATHLVVDQTPLFKKSMNPHDSANVSGEVSPAGGDGEVLGGVEAVGVDHKVAVVLVNRRSLAPILRVEELGEGPPFEWVNDGEAEPRRVGGNDDGVRLGREVTTSGGHSFRNSRRLILESVRLTRRSLPCILINCLTLWSFAGCPRLSVETLAFVVGVEGGGGRGGNGMGRVVGLAFVIVGIVEGVGGIHSLSEYDSEGGINSPSHPLFNTNTHLSLHHFTLLL